MGMAGGRLTEYMDWDDLYARILTGARDEALSRALWLMTGAIWNPRIAGMAIRVVGKWFATAFGGAILGAVMVLGYAPFNAFVIPVVALTMFFGLVLAQSTAVRAALAGFSFGLGMFGAGVSWIYISLHTYGGMSPAWAAIATALFCAMLSLFPAIFGVAAWHLRHSRHAVHVWSLPALWVATEWLRGVGVTGFPWLAVGYSQMPGSPLAGYAPVAGVYGISALVAVTAGALLHLRALDSRGRGIAMVLASAIWAFGALLQSVIWTTPVGAPYPVALLQGNISQEKKWAVGQAAVTLDTYLSLLKSSVGQLIVMPETALPTFSDQLPDAYRSAMAAHVISRNADLVMGLVERESKGERLHYYNSAVSIGASPSQTYRKQHLVPFGEYIPAKPLLGWVSSVLKIPFADMSPGTAASSSLDLQGAKVAVNICFENAFGEEILDALPEATVLVNMSNLAWFGKSLALPQHVQISQMRAAEIGRYMLSATNTGYTAIINERGHIMRRAPGHEALVLTGDAQGFEGATPYVRFGNIPVVMFAIMGIIVGVINVARAHRRSPSSLNAGTNARASQRRGAGPGKE